MGSTKDTYRVLIAGAEPAAYADLQALLEAVGCEIVGYGHDGGEVFELVNALKPDCVFLSLQAEASGDGKLVVALNETRSAPVIVIATAFQLNAVEAAVEAGAHGYLIEPVNEKDILAALILAIARFAETLTLREEADVLHEKLETRKLIERAKGILMREGLSEPEAFSRLQKLSMNSGRPIRELAQAVILSDSLHGID